MRGRVSVATLIMCDKLVSHLYSSGTASPGLPPSAAALAYWSGFSFAVTPWGFANSRCVNLACP